MNKPPLVIEKPTATEMILAVKQASTLELYLELIALRMLRQRHQENMEGLKL